MMNEDDVERKLKVLNFIGRLKSKISSSSGVGGLLSQPKVAVVDSYRPNGRASENGVSNSKYVEGDDALPAFDDTLNDGLSLKGRKAGSMWNETSSALRSSYGLHRKKSVAQHDNSKIDGKSELQRRPPSFPRKFVKDNNLNMNIQGRSVQYNPTGESDHDLDLEQLELLELTESINRKETSGDENNFFDRLAFDDEDELFDTYSHSPIPKPREPLKFSSISIPIPSVENSSPHT